MGGMSHEMAAGGLMTRLLAPLTRCVTRGWHMLFVGFLFGLSFETASEIGLLGLSASEMMNGLSPWLILAFPALFAAGMSLLDAADGAMMIGVYGWALARPKRRLVYNIIITALSVFVALLIAGIGLAGLLARHDDKAGGAFPARPVRCRHEHARIRGRLCLRRRMADCRHGEPMARPAGVREKRLRVLHPRGALSAAVPGSARGRRR